MEILDRITIPGGVHWISADDSRRIAVTSSYEAMVYSIHGGKLHREESVALYTDLPPDVSGLERPRAVLAGDAEVLVARLPEGSGISAMELAGIDLNDGKPRGSFRIDDFYAIGEPVFVPPHYALLGTLMNVFLIDLRDFQEVCRARAVDEWGDTTEEGAVPEEHIEPNGFAYDADSRMLHILCGAFGERTLYRYRLSDDSRSFHREVRQTLDARTWRGSGIALSPDRSVLAVLLQVDDISVDLHGNMVQAIDDDVVRKMLAIRSEHDGPWPAPDRVPIAKLGIYRDGSERWVTVSGDSGTDVLHMAVDDFGQDYQQPGITVGYRLSVSDDMPLTGPVWIDENRLVLCTHGGVLKLVDISGETTEDIGAFRTRITSLAYDAAERIIAIGGNDGTLTLARMP